MYQIITLYTWNLNNIVGSLHLNKTREEKKDCTGETERNDMSLQIELGDDKFWSHYQSCDIVPRIKTKIHVENIKMYLFFF